MSTLPTVIAAAGPGAHRTYGTYWARMDAVWGDRRHGRHAGEHVVAAPAPSTTAPSPTASSTHKASPAHRVAKPRRLPNTRRALTAWELEQINATARVSGNDAILDALLLRLHTETACRRGGALGIRLGDLDTDRCLVRLREKGSTVRWQPITPALAHCLVDHAGARGTVLPTDRYCGSATATPSPAAATTTSGNASANDLPWVAAQGISTHWLRHTTLTWVERHFGYGIARAYAGHTDNTGPATTTTYIKASLQEVATALAAMTGQPHPLAIDYRPGASPTRTTNLPAHPAGVADLTSGHTRLASDT